MMKHLTFLFASLITITSSAQKFDVDTLFYAGSSSRYINLVILGDGYISSELEKFKTDATSFTTEFFREAPYSNYRNYFNVFIIKVASAQSGASHPGTATDVSEPQFPVATVDNYFGSTFDNAGLHRLLVATKFNVISNVLANNTPEYDQALILVNSPYYGGSGGLYPTASTHSSSAQIAIHELGHSFASLRDEYWAGDIYALEASNMTKENNPVLIKWKNWLGYQMVGIYQHCCGGNSAQWYKPHQDCKMQYLVSPFCPVCTQATVEKIHLLVSPVAAYYPADNVVTSISYPLKFKLSLTAPVPNTLRRVWTINGIDFKLNVDSVKVNETSFVQGTNTVKVTIEDTTGFLKVNNHSTLHVYSVIWTVTKGPSGIRNLRSASAGYTVDIYPNPSSGSVNIRIQGIKKGLVKVELCNLNGKIEKEFTLSNDDVNSIDLRDLNPGIYISRLFINNTLITTKKIIKQ